MNTHIHKKPKNNLILLGSLLFGIYVTYVIYILEEDFIKAKKLRSDFSNYEELANEIHR
jgi:hypothetical protein